MGIPPTRTSVRPHPGTHPTLDAPRQPYVTASHPGSPDLGAQLQARRAEAERRAAPRPAIRPDAASDGEGSRWPGYGNILDGIDVI
ncbi:hypothetical protein FDG2_1946 [Candidatus Protofrankia californiensis]|uniref:Uncharacterized protein n=1 Tax=Candidatus Protofrankia californiensis TaxID=1839754 RepID=A0A1C3NWN9_9ACTN|nr:hypothetical protein FDG2_1946 [Candidatus Protofrankia californiensis]